MAIAVDTGSDGHSNGSGTNRTVTFSASGDTVAFLAVVLNNTTIDTVTSPNLTWTRLEDYNATADRDSLWFAVVGAGGVTSEVVTVDFAGSSSYCTLDVQAFSGTATTLDVSNSTTGSGNITVTATGSGEVLIVAACRSGSASATAQTNYALWPGTRGDFQGVQYRIMTDASGGETIDWGEAHTDQGAAIFEAAAGGGGLDIPIVYNHRLQQGMY